MHLRRAGSSVCLSSEVRLASWFGECKPLTRSRQTDGTLRAADCDDADPRQFWQPSGRLLVGAYHELKCGGDLCDAEVLTLSWAAGGYSFKGAHVRGLNGETTGEILQSSPSKDGQKLLPGTWQPLLPPPSRLLPRKSSDRCAGVTCSGHGRCFGLLATCICDDGYTDRGQECIPEGLKNTNRCAGVTCSGHGRCTEPYATCVCDSGYISRGQECISMYSSSPTLPDASSAVGDTFSGIGAIFAILGAVWISIVLVIGGVCWCWISSRQKNRVRLPDNGEELLVDRLPGARRPRGTKSGSAPRVPGTSSGSRALLLSPDSGIDVAESDPELQRAIDLSLQQHEREQELRILAPLPHERNPAPEHFDDESLSVPPASIGPDLLHPMNAPVPPSGPAAAPPNPRPTEHDSISVKSIYEIDPSELTIDAVLNSGSFGVVYKGRYHGQQVAIKKLREDNFRPELFGVELTVGCRIPPHPNGWLFIAGLFWGEIVDTLWKKSFRCWDGPHPRPNSSSNS